MAKKKSNSNSTIENISKLIEQIKNKKQNLYFFIYDTKGTPIKEIEYIYDIALTLQNLGYDVTMLHQEKEFVGVDGWAGDAYKSLVHKNVEDSNLSVSAADVLFVPELLTSVMQQIKKLPCKRIVIFQNMDYFTETATVGATFADYGIFDIIVPNEYMATKLKNYFPYVKTYNIPYSIKNYYKKYDKNKKLIINIITRTPNITNKIVKTFYWKNPIYKWVSFREIRGMTNEMAAEAISEAAATVWYDVDDEYGKSAVEVLKAGSVLIAKVPNVIPEWAIKDDALVEGPVWFDNIDELPEILSSFIRTWTLDVIPSKIMEDSEAVCKDLFTEEAQTASIEEHIINDIIAGREKDLTDIKESFEKINNNEETNN